MLLRYEEELVLAALTAFATKVGISAKSLFAEEPGRWRSPTEIYKVLMRLRDQGRLVRSVLWRRRKTEYVFAVREEGESWR